MKPEENRKDHHRCSNNCAADCKQKLLHGSYLNLWWVTLLCKILNSAKYGRNSINDYILLILPFLEAIFNHCKSFRRYLYLPCLISQNLVLTYIVPLTVINES